MLRKKKTKMRKKEKPKTITEKNCKQNLLGVQITLE